MAGDAFAAILGKKEQLKKATEDTTIGVRKGAVEKKREDAKPPVDDGKPTKFNTPRKPNEDLGVYSDRLKALQEAHKTRE